MKSEADPETCVIFWTGVPADAEQKHKPGPLQKCHGNHTFRLNTIPSWGEKKRFVNDLWRTVSGCIGVTGELKVFIGDLKVIDVKL